MGLLLVLAGCAAAPPLDTSAMPPSVRVSIGDAGIRDLRGEYRAAVCSRLADGESRCDDVLLRLSGEKPATAVPSAADLSARYRIDFVPGLFAECFDEWARPFADVEQALRGSGFETDYVRVSGCGSVMKNSEQLASYFRALEDDGRRIIVFVYSKGLADTLEFAVRSPEESARIAAIVGVAGETEPDTGLRGFRGHESLWGAGLRTDGRKYSAGLLCSINFMIL